MKIKRIIVAGNGPSAYSGSAIFWGMAEALTPSDKIFRTNYFYLTDGDPFNYGVTDWFICEDVADCRAVRAMTRFSGQRPRLWLPGINAEAVHSIEANHLHGFDIHIQKTFAQLPDRCRWDRDLAPERPLMGSFALAVAVGMQPEELYLCGHDLFQHHSKVSHAGAKAETRSWQQAFNKHYLANTHRNHRVSGDIKYIRAALQAYRGKLTVVGTVLASYFKDEFPQWDWIDG